jgi:hypothetical protein
MNLTNTYIRGLQNYKVVTVNIRPALLSAIVVISFDRLDFEGFHNTTAAAFNVGLGAGSGPFIMSIRDLVLTVTVQLDWINFERIKLNQLRVNYVMAPIADVNFQGFNGLFGAAFNVLARASLPTYVTAKQIELNQRIQYEIIPLVNEYLLTDASFADIFSFLITFMRNFAIRYAIDYVQDLVCHL